MTYTHTGRILKMTGGLYTVRLDPPDTFTPSKESDAGSTASGLYTVRLDPPDTFTSSKESDTGSAASGLYTVRLDPPDTQPLPKENDTENAASPLAGQTVECRARGSFRHEHLSPLVGDRVLLQYDHTSFTVDENGHAAPSADRTGLMIARILPRRNSLIRPPLANVDTMLVVVAAAAPDPDIPTVDKLLSILEFNHITPVMVIGKCDLAPERAAELAALYRRVGYRVFVLSSLTGEGVADFAAFARRDLRGQITAVAGASGAGKSTLLNTVFPGLDLTTGQISEKIGRGKNTTRHTQLFDLPSEAPDGEAATAPGYIADTAGFSLLDFERFDFFTLEDLPLTFREFVPHLGNCRYTDCTHLRDEGCAVLAARDAGLIPPSRHESYTELYGILKDKKKWK